MEQTKQFEEAMNIVKKKLVEDKVADSIIEERFKDAARNITAVVNEMHDEFVKNNAFVTKSILDLTELDTKYKELIAYSVEIIQDWETVCTMTQSPTTKHNAEIQKQELRQAGSKVMGLMWNMLLVADAIIKKQSEANVMLMIESDYLKKVIDQISIDGLKNTLIELYKSEKTRAPPEVREWIRRVGKPMPLYDLDEQRIEEEIPAPVPIKVKTSKPAPKEPETIVVDQQEIREKYNKAMEGKDKEPKQSDLENEDYVFNIVKKLGTKGNNYSVSMNEIRTKISANMISTTTLWRILNRMVKTGRLKAIGKNKGRLYSVGE